MRNSHLAVILGLWLAVAACSKPTQEKTTDDLKSVGSQVGQAAKDVAATPAVKDLGSDIKQGASEAAAKTKVAADQAGDKLKADAQTAAQKTSDALDKAADNATKR
ncbi:hypothetical protein [Phenylobacterium sp.]|jgi:hypothetical protein|uniref:hypothetical protein n=1 Tax=Phenylobacterium sp. TaxID=1871053 RepID=UPI002F3E8DE1